MILVDLHHLIHKTLFASVGKRAYIGNSEVPIDEYKGMFLHMFFNYLKYLKQEQTAYGDIVLCADFGTSWRKSIYPEYKGNRKKEKASSNVNFEDFYKLVNELLKELEENFPYKLIKVHSAEGDDVIGVLCKHHYSVENILVVSEDKDFVQLLKYPNISVYRPIKKEYLQVPENGVEWFINYHILLGDRVDNIPSMKEMTMFSPDFVKYCESKNIFENDVYNFLQLEISNKLIESFKQEFPDKKIYKAADFGDKGVIKFLENFEENMSKNKMFKQRFELNEMLISLDKIPSDLEEKILVEYKNVKTFSNPDKIMDFFSRYQLRKHMEDINIFVGIEERDPMDIWASLEF